MMTNKIKDWKKGKEKIQLEILNFNSDGSCHAELESKKFKVLGAIPGEIVLAEIVREFPDFSVANVSEILKSSSNRIDPPCDYYLACSGCQLQHLKYEFQLKLKTKIVNDQLAKSQKFEQVKILDTIGSDKLFHYRNHARLTVAKKPPFRGNIGFVNKFTRKIIKINKCLLMDHKINHLINFIQGKLKGMSQLSIRVGSNSGYVLMQPNFQNILPEIKSGQDKITEMFLGQPFRIGSPSFFQVNTAQAEKLSELLSVHLDLNGSETVLDAYCGVGVFSILLAPFVKEVVGIEISDSAIEDAKFNSRHLNNVRFIRGSSEESLNTLNSSPDIVILDPPRSGCNKDVLDSLLLIKPNKILMISCDLESFIRDSEIICSNDYTLKLVQPVDMFPHTKHIEVLGVIEKIN